MIAPRHLPNAPITEAIIDIRVKALPTSDPSKLAALQEAISKQYPTKEERRITTLKFEMQPGKTIQSAEDKGLHGYLFRSADNRRVAQFRFDGFTLSWLKPYETWERLRDEARSLWSEYERAFSPEIIRVATRYINRLEIPLPIEDFGEYLTSPPIVPAALPQGVSSFFTRVVIHDPDASTIGIISQALEGIVRPDTTSIILDIDVFKEDEFGTDTNRVWETLEKLRTFKNRIFFESITEKTARLFV